MVNQKKNPAQGRVLLAKSNTFYSSNLGLEIVRIIAPEPQQELEPTADPKARC